MTAFYLPRWSISREKFSKLQSSPNNLWSEGELWIRLSFFKLYCPVEVIFLRKKGLCMKEPILIIWVMAANMGWPHRCNQISWQARWARISPMQQLQWQGQPHCTTIAVYLQAVATTRPFGGPPTLLLSSGNYALSENTVLNEIDMFLELRCILITIFAVSLFVICYYILLVRNINKQKELRGL